jgi:hypothetical protein
MEYRKAGVFSLTFFLTMAASGSALAQDIQSSDFLSDYSNLTRSADEQRMDYSYLIPDAPDRIANFSAVMIDQPEIFVSPSSPYKGMKPNDMKQLADAFRNAIAQELVETYTIVDQPGPNVLYLRFAFSNLQVKKPRRRLLGYTPVGLVANVVKSAVTDITNKIDLKGITVEMEILDSTSEEQLAALLEVRSQTDEEPTSWEDVEALIGVYAKRLRCNLENARIVESSRVDCLSGT